MSCGAPEPVYHDDSERLRPVPANSSHINVSKTASEGRLHIMVLCFFFTAQQEECLLTKGGGDDELIHPGVLVGVRRSRRLSWPSVLKNRRYPGKAPKPRFMGAILSPVTYNRILGPGCGIWLLCKSSPADCAMQLVMTKWGLLSIPTKVIGHSVEALVRSTSTATPALPTPQRRNSIIGSTVS